MTQTTLGEYPSGGTSNSDRRDGRETARQRQLDAAAKEADSIRIPDEIGNYERTTAPHAGEVVRWSDGVESVSVLRVIGDGRAYEISACDSSRPNPGRFVDAADERAGAIQRAHEYMRGESVA